MSLDGEFDRSLRRIPATPKKVLMFMPCFAFGIMVDIQIISSTKHYEPIAFAQPPYPWVKPFMLVLGVISLLTSIASYMFCVIYFGGYNDGWRDGMFVCFIIKAIVWSPFIGLELYDTIFEHIYHDV